MLRITLLMWTSPFLWMIKSSYELSYRFMLLFGGSSKFWINRNEKDNKTWLRYQNGKIWQRYENGNTMAIKL